MFDILFYNYFLLKVTFCLRKKTPTKYSRTQQWNQTRLFLKNLNYWTPIGLTKVLIPGVMGMLSALPLMWSVSISSRRE